VTLFPDYPPLDDGAPQSQRRPCCETWIAFTDQYPHPPPVYVVVHSFAHGRIPFTIDALMERGDTNEHGAEGAIRFALNRDWIEQVHPEPYQRPGRPPAWVGLLPKRR
jgi:hypothetical protein